MEELGYTTNWKVLNAKDFGVPQNRERTIIVGSLNGVKFNFNELEKKPPIYIKDILEKENSKFEYLDEKEYTLIKILKNKHLGLFLQDIEIKKLEKRE